MVGAIGNATYLLDDRFHCLQPLDGGLDHVECDTAPGSAHGGHGGRSLVHLRLARAPNVTRSVPPSSAAFSTVRR